ncbi:PAS domain-containing protein [uncultured Stenotrophomonas sp.]|uniref:PAS domain-containing sensor histidine kinase n=1 Tax=uncultured Stenotrophomonas sp. TaxID=165438 RepID=UPI0028E73EE2|nr:PAS domain-containing protein [uncultured Stenotrophomonas sp.]
MVETEPSGGPEDPTIATFRALADAMPASVLLMTPDGQVEYANQQAVAFRGASVEEQRAWKTAQLIHPDDLPQAIERWAHCVATGDRFEMEYRVRRADGAYRWFHVRGQPVKDAAGVILRWCFLDVDIDDRKQGEALLAQTLAELAASKLRLRALIDTVPGFVWQAAPDGSVEFLNQRWFDYTGMQLEDALGSGWTSRIHPADATPLGAYWQGLLASGQPGSFEARLRGADDSYRWFLIRAVPLLDDTGRVLRWYGQNTDIEDRKQAELSLARVRSELAHVARVASLGALTASIAHEVNQPLSGIITNANTCMRMLNTEPPNLAGARETVRRTLRDGNRASDVVKRLRALFARTEASAEPLDLNEAAREVLALASAELDRADVCVHLDLAERLPRAWADRVQVQQVILNLLLNALEAMSALDDRPKRLWVGTSTEGTGNVRLSVGDSGTGVDPQDVERIFQAFHSTKRTGMGVGLSVSRSIIDSHGGALWVEASDAGGAMFAFTLPRAEARA